MAEFYNIRFVIRDTSYLIIIFLSHLENCLFGEWNPWTVCDPETAIKHQGYRLCGIGGKEQTRDFQEIAISNGTSCADESRKYTECQLEKEETNCKFIYIIIVIETIICSHLITLSNSN